MCVCVCACVRVCVCLCVCVCVCTVFLHVCCYCSKKLDHAKQDAPMSRTGTKSLNTIREQDEKHIKIFAVSFYFKLFIDSVLTLNSVSLSICRLSVTQSTVATAKLYPWLCWVLACMKTCCKNKWWSFFILSYSFCVAICKSFLHVKHCKPFLFI